MTLYTAIITLFLVMDPLGNIPVFLSVLKTVDKKRRTKIILRESLIAFLVLALFLFTGKYIMMSLHISEAALSLAGGIVLFLIALKMIFPTLQIQTMEKNGHHEPFIVPMAVPLLAGPSAMATVVLLTTQAPDRMGIWFIAVFVASALSTLTLTFSERLSRFLGERGLIAIERLMGMLLTAIAVQMFLTGIAHYFHVKV